MPIIEFDAVEPSEFAPRTFEALPRGDYTAMITDSVLKETKAGTGQYIALTMEIIDGSYSGRKIWDNLNVKNANPTAEKIAQASLTRYFQSCGQDLERGADTTALYNIPFKLTLGIDRNDPTRNTVLGSGPLGSAKKPKPVVNRESIVSGKKPWEK
jgi:hypothetical protein